MNEQQIAAVSSAFFFCYGIGQLFSGILGDRVSPRLLVFLGTFISALSNLIIFAFCQSPAALTVLWGINGIVQSLVWSPILRIAGDYFDKENQEKFATDISTTVTLGTLASYAVGLLTMLLLPYRFVFITCGICTLLASLYWLTETGKLNLYKGAKTKSVEKQKSSISLKKFIKLFMISGSLILLIPIAIQGTLKDSVVQWLPTLFSDKFNLGTNISIILTMILPIINVFGAYIAKAVNNKLKNAVKTALAFFTVSFIFLILLKFIGTSSAVFALVCLAAVTTCMHAINVMLITLVPLHFQKYGCVSTIGGLLNSFAYIGCGALNMIAGNILGNGSSWNSLFIFWIILSATAILVSALSAVIWKRFTKKD